MLANCEEREFIPAFFAFATKRDRPFSDGRDKESGDQSPHFKADNLKQP